MFPKVLFAILAAGAIGAGLLALRHQRLTMKNEMALLHREMDQTRRETWDLQIRIAERSSPVALRDAILRTGIELEPLAPTDVTTTLDPAHVAHRRGIDTQRTRDTTYADGVPR